MNMAHAKRTMMCGLNEPIEEINSDGLLRAIREADAQRHEIERQKKYWDDRFMTLLGEMKRRIDPNKPYPVFY